MELNKIQSNADTDESVTKLTFDELAHVAGGIAQAVQQIWQSHAQSYVQIRS